MIARLSWLWVLIILLLAGIYILFIYKPVQEKTEKVSISSQLASSSFGRKLTFRESFEKSIGKHISPDAIADLSADGGMGIVKLKQSEDIFGSKDQVYKVFFIEVANIFREVEQLKRIKMDIPFEGKAYTLNVRREIVEGHFDGLKTLNDSEWEDTMEKFDNFAARKLFVDRYVQVR